MSDINYTPVIGLEVHIELATKSKMFCRCSAEHFSVPANTHVCPVCMGLPGALPVANQTAIEDTIKFGLAFDCTINAESKFDRKHYFYPDLPKGYQISQYDMPLCIDGHWTSPSGKTVTIKRIHLEEDTGKLIHDIVKGKKVSLVDYNRSSVPLMEMVTEPDFDNMNDVDEFLREVQRIVRYLGISSADMEKGSMRLEANISMRTVGETKLPSYKIELKNINSFRFLKKAVEAEIVRQTELLKNGETPAQETRGYNETKGKTFSQRTKEDAHDYRYFPEPDVPPLSIPKENVEAIRATLPELPEAKRIRFATDYELSKDYIDILVSDLARANYFDTATQLGEKHSIAPRTIAGAMINQHLDEKYTEPAELIKVLYEMQTKEYASAEAVQTAIDVVLAQNEKEVKDFNEGKTQLIGFFIGQVQKELKGTADPKVVQQALTVALNR